MKTRSGRHNGLSGGFFFVFFFVFLTTLISLHEKTLSKRQQRLLENISMLSLENCACWSKVTYEVLNINSGKKSEVSEMEDARLTAEIQFKSPWFPLLN